MQEEIPPIDEMPNLKARLGKARTDRIRYAGQEDPSRQKHATNLTNAVLNKMQFVSPHRPGCPVTDILTGAAHLDIHQAKPLSVDRLFNMFQCLTTINTREIIKMMSLDQRQARRYVRAAKFALPHLESHFRTTEEGSRTYTNNQQESPCTNHDSTQPMFRSPKQRPQKYLESAKRNSTDDVEPINDVLLAS